MPTQVKEKVIDPEAELSNAMRTFKTLAPICSVAKRSEGEPQLQIQEKQINILKHEMTETLLCIRLASQGQHGIRDASIKHEMLKSIVDYESFEAVLRNERAQQSELDLLNYLGNKNLIELLKAVPTDADLQISLEASCNRLRRMENSLDLATTRFCRVNTDNRKIREEIHRLLVERNSFNIQWNNTIDKLIKGRQYLMDIFEIATAAFGARDEICRKLETLKWRGLYQLNRDIAEMQSYEGELNHLAKLEEFLRMKGTRRICEADEIEEAKRQEEIVRCEQEINKFDALLEDIFEYSGVNRVNKVMRNFNNVEKINFSLFVLMCQTMQESIYLTKELETLRQKIMDSCDQNEARREKQDAAINNLTQELDELRELTQNLRNENLSSENLLLRVYKGIDDLVRLAKCELNPLVKLLGNHKEVRKFNYRRFIVLLEIEVKNLIEVVYGAVKPPAPTPRGKGAAPPPPTKIVADPRFELIRPNTIDRLVPYQPCAYCVEDYIMNQVFETPAVPANDEYVQSMFRLEDVNTKFGIYTLTIPAKRHPIKTKAE